MPQLAKGEYVWNAEEASGPERQGRWLCVALCFDDVVEDALDPKFRHVGCFATLATSNCLLDYADIGLGWKKKIWAGLTPGQNPGQVKAIICPTTHTVPGLVIL
jgi:hypothetical protein